MRPRGERENGLRIWAVGLLISMMMAGHVFAQAAVAPSNPEMARIFSEDQSDRFEGVDIDWAKFGARDLERRTATRT